jgi:hypothetical protein
MKSLIEELHKLEAWLHGKGFELQWESLQDSISQLERASLFFSNWIENLREELASSLPDSELERLDKNASLESIAFEDFFAMECSCSNCMNEQGQGFSNECIFN